MNAVLSIALSGLGRHAQGVQVVAHNVANANTDGFRSLRFNPGTGNTQPRFYPMDSGWTDSDEPPPSDVDLAREFVDLKLFEIGYRANAMVLVAADRMQGELLDLFG